VVAVQGSKLTAYRGIAEEATDRVCKLLGVDQKCRTADVPLPGAQRPLRPAQASLTELVHIAVRQEQCARLVDFIFRRTDHGFTPNQGAYAAETAAQLMAAEYGWTPERTAAELALYHQVVAQTQRFRG
jgi:glycerol-3-phosphate dehydrogenase